MIFTSAANIINVCAIQLYFKMRSSTSPNPGPEALSRIPSIRSPNILANFSMLGGAIIHVLRMLRGGVEMNKYSLHLTVAMGVSTGGAIK